MEEQKPDDRSWSLRYKWVDSAALVTVLFGGVLVHHGHPWIGITIVAIGFPVGLFYIVQFIGEVYRGEKWHPW